MAQYQYVIHSCTFMLHALKIAIAHVNCLSVLALRSVSKPGRASIREVLCAKDEVGIDAAIRSVSYMERRLVAGGGGFESLPVRL